MDSKVFVLGRDIVPSHIELQAGESLSAIFVAPYGVSGNFDVQIDLVGPGAELDLAGLYLCNGNQEVQFNLNVRHLSGHCRSRQLFKGLADGQSRVNFNGLVYVAGDAQQTEALQENHSLLLSPDALVQSRPQLEIYADDVVCSHGATIGSLDEQALFYMCSRGIDRATAQQLLIQSFLSPVLSRLSAGLLTL